jgi:hypothetical protein
MLAAELDIVSAVIVTKSLSYLLASLFLVAVLVAYLKSRAHPARHATLTTSVPIRMLGYLGGCCFAALLIYCPFWFEDLSGNWEGSVVLLYLWALGLGGAIAGSLIALASAAQPSTRSFWLAPAQGLAATLIPAYVCAQATARFGIGFGLAAVLLIGLAFLSAGTCWFVYRALARLFATGPSAA